MSRNLNKQRQYQRKYMRKHRMLSVLLHEKNDKDIIEWLEKQENQSEAVRKALREVRL